MRDRCYADNRMENKTHELQRYPNLASYMLQHAMDFEACTSRLARYLRANYFNNFGVATMCRQTCWLPFNGYLRLFERKSGCSNSKLTRQICGHGAFWRLAASQRGKRQRAPWVRSKRQRLPTLQLQVIASSARAPEPVPAACYAVGQANNKSTAQPHISVVHAVPPRPRPPPREELL